MFAFWRTTASRRPSGAHAAMPFGKPPTTGGGGKAYIGRPAASTKAMVVSVGVLGEETEIDMYAITSRVGLQAGSPAADPGVGRRRMRPSAIETSHSPGHSPVPAA